MMYHKLVDVIKFSFTVRRMWHQGTHANLNNPVTSKMTSNGEQAIRHDILAYKRYVQNCIVKHRLAMLAI